MMGSGNGRMTESFVTFFYEDGSVQHFDTAPIYGQWHRRKEGDRWRLRDRFARIIFRYHCWDCMVFA